MGAMTIPAIGHSLLSSPAPVEALLAHPIQFIKYHPVTEKAPASTISLWNTAVEQSSKTKQVAQSRDISHQQLAADNSKAVQTNFSGKSQSAGKSVDEVHSNTSDVARTAGQNSSGKIAVSTDSVAHVVRQNEGVEPTDVVESKNASSKTPTKRKSTDDVGDRSPQRVKTKDHSSVEMAVDNVKVGDVHSQGKGSVDDPVKFEAEGQTTDALSKEETAEAKIADMLNTISNVHTPSKSSGIEASATIDMKLPKSNGVAEATNDSSKKRKAEDEAKSPNVRRLKTSESHESKRVQSTPSSGLKGGSVASTVEAETSRLADHQRPANGTRAHVKVKGFFNPNMLCYRNSVLQLLASHEGLRQRCVEHWKTKDERKCMKKDKPCTVCVLGWIFEAHLHHTPKKSRVVSNDRVKATVQLKKVLPHPFGQRDYGQQDAAEYFHAVVYQAEEILEKFIKDERLKKDHLIRRTFGGTYCSIVTCPNCGNDSVGKQERISLQLQPQPPKPPRSKAPVDLTDCIKSYFTAESVDASCEKCKYKTGAAGQKKKFQKRNDVEKYPEFLVLDIMRYHNARMSGRYLTGDKLMNRLKFPEHLPLLEKGKEVEYELISVVAHSGHSIKHGHYVSYVRQPDGTWAECNDEQVTQVDFVEVATCDRGAYQASMLGYRRMGPESARL